MQSRSLFLPVLPLCCIAFLASCGQDATTSSTATPTAAVQVLSAQPVVNGQFNVVCSYSHTLGDDPIMMPGMAGMSMLHDFFGNKSANADSTSESLLASAEITCDNLADRSSYWAPTLRRNGVIIPPGYQKTYYRALNVLNYPVTPFPPGLKLVAGSPLNTGPNSVVTYFCKGNSTPYTSTPATYCSPWSSDPEWGVQFNIGIYFPDCWDGVNMTPTRTYKNAVYSNNGACPADYPVHIPQLNFNIAYPLGQDPDMSNVELSLDPVMNPDGSMTEKWGNLYTAHADFFNAWASPSLTFMTEYCLNKGRACNKDIAYAYSEASADTYIANTPDQLVNFGSAPYLLAQTGSPTQQRKTFIRFPIPAEASSRPFDSIYLSIYGGNISDTTARNIPFRTVTGAWDESTLTWNNGIALCPEPGNTYVNLYLNDVQQYRNIDVTTIVRNAMNAGKTEVSFCAETGGNPLVFQFSSKEGANKPYLMFRSYYAQPAS